jgi:hypothetical protein
MDLPFAPGAQRFALAVSQEVSARGLATVFVLVRAFWMTLEPFEPAVAASLAA